MSVKKGYQKTSDVVSRCSELYGGRYTLNIPDELVYRDAKVLCECNVHKEKKYVNLRHFLAGDSCGCKSCVQEKQRLEEKANFIEKFRAQWGDRYTFDKLNYISFREPGVITCKEHGDFELSEIRYAFDKTPCPTCYEIEKKRERNENYLARLNERFGNQYTWLTTDFGNYFTDYVEFVCPKHGVVKQTLSTLLNAEDEDNLACPICKRERNARKNMYELDEAIEKARSLDCCQYYDFSLINEWLGVKEKHKFRCVKHNVVFEQTFDSLFQGHNGCPGCKADTIRENCAYTNNEFIEKAKKVHGNKFDYSLVDYINSTTKVNVICPKHGVFKTTPTNHLNGCGCPKCRESLLETVVRVFLEENHIEYIKEKSVRDLTGKMKGGNPQRVDFFLPKYNICIECQGEQHFRPTRLSLRMSEKSAKSNYEKCCEYDKFKYDALTERGFDVVYFTKFWNIKTNPNGWYADKKCFYDLESLFDYINTKDYEAIKMDWYDKKKYILVPFKSIKKTIWNENTCREEAKKYKTSTEFYKKSPTAYGYACRNKWVSSYDWFIETHHKWTYDECYSEAKKCTSRKEFEQHNRKAYNASLKHKWIDDYTWLKPVRVPWTYEQCREEAGKHETRTKFQKAKKGAYNVSLKNGWLDEFFPSKNINPQT